MTIKCLNCGGAGYTVWLSIGGIKRPVTCRGCQGTGTQTVRPQ